MEITKKVQLLTKEDINANGLYRYDFLDIESNLPFSIYSKDKLKIYEALEPYKLVDTKFNLVYQKSSINGNTVIAWKVKGAEK